MAIVFVARSAKLSEWASDVGLSKYVFKAGFTAEPPKQIVAAGWCGETDWTLIKTRAIEDNVTEEAVLERLATKAKMIDPALYPRLKGVRGVFKVTLAQVENHILLTRALAGEAESPAFKAKAADFAAYLLANAVR